MSASRDIRAPDGTLREGTRLVRKGGVLTFAGSRWKVPEGWGRQGDRLAVKMADFWGTELWAARPGYQSVSEALQVGACVKIKALE